MSICFYENKLDIYENKYLLMISFNKNAITNELEMMIH